MMVRRDDRRVSLWQAWPIMLAAAIAVVTSISLAVAFQPGGSLAPVIVMATAIVLVSACAVAVLVLVQGRAVQIPVQAAARRTPAPQRLWDADAPGRPRPRAPGDGCFRALD